MSGFCLDALHFIKAPIRVPLLDTGHLSQDSLEITSRLTIQTSHPRAKTVKLRVVLKQLITLTRMQLPCVSPVAAHTNSIGQVERRLEIAARLSL